MMRIAFCVLLSMLFVSPAVAEKRVALVIGNSAYQYTPKLANPKNDATDVATALRTLGFQVIDGFDLDKVSLDRKVRDFASALQGAKIGVFFFAGHGLQAFGHNYLVPVDAQLSTAAALDFEMVRLDLVQRTMEREAQTNILFLDACRDNPLARNLAGAMGTRSAEIGRGLAAMESGVGTLISFSTQPGNVALDGTGRNSPFAGSLVRRLSSPGDDLSTLLISVRNDVMKETQRKQVPWEHSSLTGRFYFNPKAQTATPQEAARLSEAAEAWDRVRDLASLAAFEGYLARYGDSFYGELARVRIEELKKEQSPVASSGGLTEKQQRIRRKVLAENELIEDYLDRMSKASGPLAKYAGIYSQADCLTPVSSFNLNVGMSLLARSLIWTEGDLLYQALALGPENPRIYRIVPKNTVSLQGVGPVRFYDMIPKTSNPKEVMGFTDKGIWFHKGGNSYGFIKKCGRVNSQEPYILRSLRKTWAEEWPTSPAAKE